MPPIVSIVGKSNSGKTTLMEKLVRELKSRGYRIATIKHTPQGVSTGESSKDDWRHLRAGSQATVTSSPDKVVLIKPVTQELSIDEILPLFGEDYDIILIEGYAHGSTPKIEVHRKDVGPLLEAITRRFAIVTDEPLETKTRQFSPEDVKGIADLIEEGFIKPQSERVSLYVDNIPVVLSSFPKEFIGNVLLGMVSSLKGVGEFRSLKVFMARKPKQG